MCGVKKTVKKGAYLEGPIHLQPIIQSFQKWAECLRRKRRVSFLLSAQGQSVHAHHRRVTELELTPVGAHTLPRLPNERADPQDSSKAARKSTEAVGSGSALHQSAGAPATAVPASTPASRRMARIQFAVLCWVYFLAGWNDGTTGPLLGRIQTVYSVRLNPSPSAHRSNGR